MLVGVGNGSSITLVGNLCFLKISKTFLVGGPLTSAMVFIENFGIYVHLFSCGKFRKKETEGFSVTQK